MSDLVLPWVDGQERGERWIGCGVVVFHKKTYSSLLRRRRTACDLHTVSKGGHRRVGPAGAAILHRRGTESFSSKGSPVCCLLFPGGSQGPQGGTPTAADAKQFCAGRRSPKCRSMRSLQPRTPSWDLLKFDLLSPLRALSHLRDVLVQIPGQEALAVDVGPAEGLRQVLGLCGVGGGVSKQMCSKNFRLPTHRRDAPSPRCVTVARSRGCPLRQGTRRTRSDKTRERLALVGGHCAPSR